MSEQDVLLAEARLLHAACAYVDAAQEDDALNDGTLYGELESAREDYRAALRALPVLPADHPLVRQGMVVVERLLERRWCENPGCGSGALLDDLDECPRCGARS
jgi:hypothetical protein